jgi:hypothetical protein
VQYAYAVTDEGQPGNDLRCSLCNLKMHKWRQCRIYPGEQPSNQNCTQCNGRHVAACKMKKKNSADVNAIEAA